MSDRVSETGLGFDEYDACPYCGSDNIGFFEDKVICLDCGSIIYEDIIDTDYEKRFFSTEDLLMRRTIYSGTPIDANLHMIKIGLDKDKFVPKDAKTKNVILALSYLNEIAASLNLSKDLKEMVFHYFGILMSKKSIRREKVKPIISALVLICSRLAGYPRTLERISKATDIKKKEINKAYKLIKKYLKIKIPVANPEKFVYTFGRELHLSSETIRKGLEILKKVREAGIFIGKDPAGIAAASLYIASKITGERRTQRKFSEVAGVTEVTIRNRYKEILDALNLKIEEIEE